ncbi:MAG: phosphoglycerate kinase [Raoultibacter sp.]|jgi:phosphoglycerate kinase
MSSIRTLEDAHVEGKRVLLRVDFNVPLDKGQVSDDTRIRAALPTITFLREHGAKIIIISHLGRPEGIGYEEKYSLAPVAAYLSEIIGEQVLFAADGVGSQAKELSSSLENGQILMLENLRFDKREKKNDPEFCKDLASLGEMYVDDAFGVAHRAHASVCGLAKLLPSYGGYLLVREVDTLQEMLEQPKRPFVAILGGSKVSDKIKVIDALIDTCDTLIVGGGMCFTFLLALGYQVGSSLQEKDLVESCKQMIDKAQKAGVALLLPVDVRAADKFAEDAHCVEVPVSAIPDDMMGLDIGPETEKLYEQAIAKAHTVFWNGPMGVFEMPAFESGTKKVAEAVAANEACDSIIGGGDSVAAVNKFGLADKMSFISTGGGASMELVQGEKLPGVEVLR